MGILLRSVAHLAAETALRCLTPTPPLNLNDWAASNIVFGPESAMQGPYNPDEFPFFREILNALGPEDPCREVVLKKSAQLGGTVIAQIFALASLGELGWSFLYTHPSDDNAGLWVKSKLRPMVTNSPALSRKLGKGAFGRQDYIDGPGGRGQIRVASAASAPSLSMFTAFGQVQDDLAKWEMTPAGDPESMADSRSQAVRDAKILKISTPLVWPGCRITRAFLQGTQEYYHVPCPQCGHRHPWLRENFVIDRDHPERSHFVCPSCGGVIEQHHRRAMNLAGEWVASNPAARTYCRSFALWSALSPLMDWGAIARATIAAEGDPEQEKVLANDVYGDAFKTDGDAPDWVALKARADQIGHRRGLVPAGHPIVTIGIDCQGDRVEWHAQAFGPLYRLATVEYGVIQGHISEDETRARLDDLVKRRWRSESGAEIDSDKIAIDGNTYTDDVLDWAKRHSKVMVVRGTRNESAPLLALVKYERDRKGKVRRRQGRWFNVNVSALKLARYQNLKKTDPLKRGFVSIPSGMEDAFFEQYTAEKRVPKKAKTGSAYTPYIWFLAKGERNEVLDTAVYGEAAAIRAGVREFTEERWAALIAEREIPPAGGQLDMDDLLSRPVLPAPPVVVPADIPPAPPPAARRGWASRIAT